MSRLDFNERLRPTVAQAHDAGPLFRELAPEPESPREPNRPCKLCGAESVWWTAFFDGPSFAVCADCAGARAEAHARSLGWVPPPWASKRARRGEP